LNNNRATADPVRVGDYNALGDAPTPRAFAASLMEMTVEQLEELLHKLEESVKQPNAPGSARREQVEVAWELERRQTARSTRQRRQASISAQHDFDRQDVEAGPPVFAHGRPLDERELRDLDARIAWVVSRGRGERP
jgi:hypothetical protein